MEACKQKALICCNAEEIYSLLCSSSHGKESYYSFGNLGCLFIVLETATKANTLNCRYYIISRS